MGYKVKIYKSKLKPWQAVAGSLILAAGAGAVYDGVTGNSIQNRVKNKLDQLKNPKPVTESYVEVDNNALRADGFGLWEIVNDNLKNEGKPFGISEFMGERASKILKINGAESFNDFNEMDRLKLPDDNNNGHVFTQKFRQYETDVKGRMAAVKKNYPAQRR